MTYWLKNVVEPNLASKTAANYEMFARLYIVPAIGAKRLDKLTVRDVQTWVNKIRALCQCCAQGKDAARPVAHSNPKRRRQCCAVGKCCASKHSEWTVHDAYMTLRAALSNAVREETLSRNIAANIKMPVPRKRKVKPWSVDEARTFLESARTREDPMYPAYVLVLVLGLRLGEALGLRWEDVDLANAEMSIGWQLQRVAGKLLYRRTKTDASDATLPFPEIVTAALRARQRARDEARETAGDSWQETGLVFTTASGRPVEPSKSSAIGWIRSRCCISALYGPRTTSETTEAQTGEASLAWAFRWVEPRRFELLTSCLQRRMPIMLDLRRRRSAV
ncbi:site-specific integrase [Streptosporangium sp. NPDC006007]|uniref:site-specific integrase n=1 Tax=Streptosporangium sp. NPDC006007 TaxID=3154575 RepID=UPI0033A04D63